MGYDAIFTISPNTPSQTLMPSGAAGTVSPSRHGEGCGPSQKRPARETDLSLLVR
jgi:hypothetical protein